MKEGVGHRPTISQHINKSTYSKHQQINTFTFGRWLLAAFFTHFFTGFLWTSWLEVGGGVKSYL
jgi:hypothetical protein